jgi:hypothetical protein
VHSTTLNLVQTVSLIVLLSGGGLLAGVALAVWISWPVNTYRKLMDLGGGSASPNAACHQQVRQIEKGIVQSSLFCLGILISVVPVTFVIIALWSADLFHWAVFLTLMLLAGSGLAVFGLLNCLAYKVMLVWVKKAYPAWSEPDTGPQSGRSLPVR